MGVLDHLNFRKPVSQVAKEKSKAAFAFSDAAKRGNFMNKEIYERSKMHVNIGTMYALGKTAQEFVLKVEDIYSKPHSNYPSAQDLIEEARKARELDERQEA